MRNIETVRYPTPRVDLHEIPNGYEVSSANYSLRFNDHIQYIGLYDSKGTLWTSIYKGSALLTTVSADVTYAFSPVTFETLSNGAIQATIDSETERGGLKRQTWVCHEGYIQTYVTANLTDNLQAITLLGGTTVQPNLFGTSMSERHFKSVYNPQPSERETPILSAFESTRITSSGMWQPGRRREFLITPFVYGFGMSDVDEHIAAADQQWLIAGISAPIDTQNITDYRYNAVEDGYTLELTYDNTPTKGKQVTTPSLILRFASTIEGGLQDFTSISRELGHLQPYTPREQPSWHTDTTFVSWGRQLELEREDNHVDGEKKAKDFMTEASVNEALRNLEANDVPIGKLILDDKWQLQYGTNTPDTAKWPDLARFNNAQHELGRHVLLWVKLFDAEGLPPELCILNAKGQSIASDPTNPLYLELLRAQIGEILSPTAINADGLKLDFLAQLPNGPGLRWHGNKRGPAALHELLHTIYSQAKQSKPDSLIEAQVVNPWFADVFNQVRLNDTNDRHSVTRTMAERAKLSLALLPHHSIDPDGWPMPNKVEFMAYLKLQPALTGTVTTHFVETVNGERLTTDDYKIISQLAHSVTGSNSQ